MKTVVHLSDVSMVMLVLGSCLTARPEQVVRAVLLRDPVQDEVVGGAEIRHLAVLSLLLQLLVNGS